MIFVAIFLLRTMASRSVVEVKISFMMMILFGVARCRIW